MSISRALVSFGLTALSFFAATAASAASVDMSGLWTHPCRTYSGDKSIIWSITIKDGQKQETNSNYDNPKCEGTPAYTIIQISKVDFTDTPASLPGAFNLDVHILSSTLFVLSKERIAYFNSKNLCGIHNWKAFEPRDISHAPDCLSPGAPWTTSGRMSYQIYRLENGKKWIPAGWDGVHDARTPESRSVILDESNAVDRIE